MSNSHFCGKTFNSTYSDLISNKSGYKIFEKIKDQDVYAKRVCLFKIVSKLMLLWNFLLICWELY